MLVGPVDYIVLKRKGILPMTWVTSAFWIVLFSFGAYHGVQALRGGTLQMRHVTVLDGIQIYNEDGTKGATDAWATNYSAVFAPKSDEYELVDSRKNQWYSAISPAERQIYSFNSQSSSKQIHCDQHDGSHYRQEYNNSSIRPRPGKIIEQKRDDQHQNQKGAIKVGYNFFYEFDHFFIDSTF